MIDTWDLILALVCGAIAGALVMAFLVNAGLEDREK